MDTPVDRVPIVRGVVMVVDGGAGVVEEVVDGLALGLDVGEADDGRVVTTTGTDFVDVVAVALFVLTSTDLPVKN